MKPGDWFADVSQMSVVDVTSLQSFVARLARGGRVVAAVGELFESLAAVAGFALSSPADACFILKSSSPQYPPSSMAAGAAAASIPETVHAHDPNKIAPSVA